MELSKKSTDKKTMKKRISLNNDIIKNIKMRIIKTNNDLSDFIEEIN